MIRAQPSIDAFALALSAARAEDAAVLESGQGFGSIGHFSIYAVRPRAVFEVVGERWSLSGDWPGERPKDSVAPFRALRFLVGQTAGNPDRSLPFAGGWIGYLGYDLAPLLERLPRRQPREGTLPDLSLGYYDAFAIRDVLRGTTSFHAVDPFKEGSARRRARLDAFRSILEPAPSEPTMGPLVPGLPESNFAADDYCAAVDRALEYIRAGDVFQVNLAQRFSAPFHGRPEELFRRCLVRSPAPFSALLRRGSWSVVSTSPERFLRLDPSRRVETRPIKGTRPRGRDAVCDLFLKEELASSAKDRAELTMIVDLERNDLGKVCDFGTVRVSRHAAIESYSNVHHLVSTVEGRLHGRFGPVDLVRATFPGGSITGAPKIRAMQIIDELERCRRGVYTGAIGYFSDNGRMDWNVAIRTLVVDGGVVFYHVGGGIVVDSDPLAEYRETLAKGSRLREILLEACDG